MLCTFPPLSYFSLATWGWGCCLFTQDHYKMVALAWYDWQLSCLVGVYDVSHVFHHHTDFHGSVLWYVEDELGVLLMFLFCRSYSLALLSHVAFLHFVGFQEIFINCCCCEHGLGCIEPHFYCFYPCGFGWEPCCGMLLLYNLFYAWEFVYIVCHFGEVFISISAWLGGFSCSSLP